MGSPPHPPDPSAHSQGSLQGGEGRPNPPEVLVTGPKSVEPFACAGFHGEVVGHLRPADAADFERELARLLDPAAAVATVHWGRNYIYRARLDRPPWPAEAPAEVAVKQFRNEGLKARLRRRLGGSKAARSWRIARALGAAGLLTPEPVLLADSDRAEGPSAFVTRYVDGVFEARYLFRALDAGEEAERFPQVDVPRFMTALGETVRRLHAVGIWHRDLSSGNVLVRWRGGDLPPDLYLVDLNRARAGRRPTLSERTRDLCRLRIFRPEHQRLFLAAYWGGPPGLLRRALYHAYHRGFLLKNRGKAALRGVFGGAGKSLSPRRAHAHIPAPPPGSSSRDKVVWDALSDQPHQHAGRLEKLAVRLADAGAHLRESAAAAGALPRVRRRYRELKDALYREPVPWRGAGVCLRPWPDDPEALVAAVDDLGVRHLLVRLHPWEADHRAAEELARELAGRGYELTFALPQNRDLVRDLGRWRAAVEEIGERFTPYGTRFQIGQAINRSKWGVWTLGEYLALAAEAAAVLRRREGVELLGPAVIDFEPHATAAALNVRGGIRFDAAASLLYVDRRGAPENPQAGFDTVAKVVLMRAIADTARNCDPRLWITEVNWPLREGPHAPAGRSVAVDEETQADYLARYYLLALGTGLAERVFWWQAVARGYGLVAPGCGRGEGLRRRPSFAALANLERQLAGSVFAGPLPAPSPARLYRFRRPGGGTVVVAWSAGGAPGGIGAVDAVKVELPERPRCAVGRDGASLPPPEGVTVRLGGSPVYYHMD